MQDRKWELEVGQRWERTAAEAAPAPAATETGAASVETLERDLPWKWRPRPVMTFLLQFANGLRRGVRYYEILGQDDLGGEIVLYCERCTITIKGRHQEQLNMLLAEDRVLVIEEQHRPDWKDESSRPYIESITIGKPRLEALESVPQRQAMT